VRRSTKLKDVKWLSSQVGPDIYVPSASALLAWLLERVPSHEG
jgi:hypothetical protein